MVLFITRLFLHRKKSAMNLNAMQANIRSVRIFLLRQFIFSIVNKALPQAMQAQRSFQ